METWMKHCTIPLSWVLLLLCQCLTVGTRDLHSATSTTNSSGRDGNTAHGGQLDFPDVVSVRLGRDGLRELRISFRGVLVLETSRVPRRNTQDVQHAVRLLQVTDGRRVVQTVKEGEVTRDCIVSRDAWHVLHFLDQYLHGAPRHAHHGDVLAAYSNTTRLAAPRNTVRARGHSTAYLGSKRLRHSKRTRDASTRAMAMPVRNRQSLGRFARYVHVLDQARECRKFQSRARQRLDLSGSAGGQKNSSSDSQVHATSTSSLAVQEHATSTSSLDSQGNATSWSSVGIQNHTASRRQKRDLLSGWFIFPGTKWCGDGDIAEHGDDLGYDESLDTCCREHDRCRHVIPRVSWRYSLFNYRLHTLSHCRCDRRFRRCLKKSTSPAAHMVGKIYFNVIGPQCFKFTKTKTCKRRNWWGKCKRYGFTKVAYPKRQRSF